MHLLPYFGLSLALCGFIVAAVYSQRKAIRLNARGWDDLVERLERVEPDGVKVVARDYLDPQQGQIALEPPELWKLVGGYEGLRRMRANADLMLALAAHAQYWNFDEATIVAERMRLDSWRLRRALRRIEFGSLPYFAVRRFWLRIPLQVQEAAAAYYLMRQRLLSLYATSHSGLYPRLAEIL
jgi:hypothetical protein